MYLPRGRGFVKSDRFFGGLRGKKARPLANMSHFIEIIASAFGAPLVRFPILKVRHGGARKRSESEGVLVDWTIEVLQRKMLRYRNVVWSGLNLEWLQESALLL